VNSFSYITKILGPQDVLSVLLTNLRVQEWQIWVCSTVDSNTDGSPTMAVIHLDTVVWV
jgi:hypothetical protein